LQHYEIKVKSKTATLNIYFPLFNGKIDTSTNVREFQIDSDTF